MNKVVSKIIWNKLTAGVTVTQVRITSDAVNSIWRNLTARQALLVIDLQTGGGSLIGFNQLINKVNKLIDQCR
jgi:hypothetical protein